MVLNVSLASNSVMQRTEMVASIIYLDALKEI